MLSLASPSDHKVFTVIVDEETYFKCSCQDCCDQLARSLMSALHKVQGPMFILNPSKEDLIALVLDPCYADLWITHAFVQENKHLTYPELIGALVSLGHEYSGPEKELPRLTPDQIETTLEHLYEQFRLHHPLLSLFYELMLDRSNA